MPKKGHSEEQILRALHQAESGTKVSEICREHGISDEFASEWKESSAASLRTAWPSSASRDESNSHSSGPSSSKYSALPTRPDGSPPILPQTPQVGPAKSEPGDQRAISRRKPGSAAVSGPLTRAKSPETAPYSNDSRRIREIERLDGGWHSLPRTPLLP